jgi:protocatechuate 3,4-dioxygenase beta subunit
VTVATIALATALPLSAVPPHQGMLPVSPNTPDRPAALILGQVVDAETNKPIARALAIIARAASADAANPGPPTTTPPLDSPRVMTDQDGRFVFRGLSAGVYQLSGSAPNYLDGSYGQRRPGGLPQSFVLRDQERVGGVVIHLWRAAIVRGTVSDGTGAPLADVSVRLDPISPVAATQAFGPRPSYWQNSVTTDDRGRYEIGGIAPGRYVASVSATLTTLPASMTQIDSAGQASLRASGLPALAMGGRGLPPVARLGDLFATANSPAVSFDGPAPADRRRLARTTTLHPDATSLTDATVITLRTGETRSGIDIRMQPVSAVPVSGTIRTPDGPLPHFAVHLIPADVVGTALERRHETAVTVADGTGTFTFPAVAPGRYVAAGWRLQPSAIGPGPLPAEPALWGRVPVTVGDAPLDAVDVVLQPGAALRGRVIFDGAQPAPLPGRTQTALGTAFEPAWPLAIMWANRIGVRVAPSGEFVTQALPPGPLLPNFAAPLASLAGWSLESATLNGRDLAVSPLMLEGKDVTDIVVTLTDRPAEISGLITTADGRPAPSALVITFPADYEAWIRGGLSPSAARVAVPLQTGAYTLTAVPPGDRIVAATTEETLATWSATTIRTLAATGLHVSLPRRGSIRVELRSK